jgi:hypothetical protein
MAVALAAVGTWAEQADLATPYDAVLTPIPATVQEGDGILHVQCWKDTAAFSRDSTANIGSGPFRRGGSTTTAGSAASTPDTGGMKAFQECWAVGNLGRRNANSTHASSGGTGYGIALGVNMVLRAVDGRPAYCKYMTTNADTSVTTNKMSTFVNFTTSTYAPLEKGDLIVIVAFQTDSTATLTAPVIANASGTGWSFTDPVLQATKVSAVGNKMVARIWTCHVAVVGNGNCSIDATAGSNATAQGIYAISVWGAGYPAYVIEPGGWNGSAAAAAPGTSVSSAFGGTAPTGVLSGDVCFVQLFRKVASAITATPAGWTLLSSNVVNGVQHEVWWFTHDGSATNRTISWTTSCQWIWSCIHVRGLDPKTPVDSIVVGLANASTIATVPAQTPSQPYCARLLLAGWIGSTNGGANTISIPLDTQLTENLFGSTLTSPWTTEPKAANACFGFIGVGDSVAQLPADDWTWSTAVVGGVVAALLLRPGPLLKLRGGVVQAAAPKYAQPEFWGSIPL